MTANMIIRAWKDPKYRASLAPEEQARIPESPAGKPLQDLTEEELGLIAGGLNRPTHCCGLDI